MNDRLPDTALLAPAASVLLQEYQAGSGYFSSPRQSMLAIGQHQVLPPCAAEEAAACVRQTLQAEGQTGRLVLGALPFERQAAAHLFVPQQVLRGRGSMTITSASAAASSALQAAGHASHHAARLHAIGMTPEPAQYRHKVTRILQEIASGYVEKVVLSRALHLHTTIDRAALLRRLAARNQHGYSFALDVPAVQAGQTNTLLGASPELLLAREGLQIFSHPLAGSIPRSSDPDEDQRRAAGLLRSGKDLREHQLVTDAVAQALRPYCRKLHLPSQPSLLATPTMWHLGTQIHGELHDPSTTSLELALALHPTPAVCGHPALAARDLIAEIEGFDRRFFAGMVGWCDEHGDGEWAVTLRCGEIGAQHATLYAGAGIVAGSDPESELRETSAKLRTMLAAMGLDEELLAILNGEHEWSRAA